MADESGRSWRPPAARPHRTDPCVRRWRDGSLRAPRWPAPAHQRKWPQVSFWRGRRTPRSRVRAAHLRTSRHVRPSVAEVSELFFDGCDGSGSSVRTPAVISLRAVCWGDARAPPRLAWPRRTAIFPRREAKLPVSSRDVAAGRAAAHIKIRAARLGLAADGNACDAHGWHGRAEKPLGRATAEAPLVRCVFVF